MNIYLVLYTIGELSEVEGAFLEASNARAYVRKAGKPALGHRHVEKFEIKDMKKQEDYTW